MNEPRHSDPDLDELLGAYALDAVSPDERERVEAYLAIDPRARDEVDGHHEVASLLAVSGGPAPADIWARIAGQLHDRAPAPSGELARVIGIDAGTRRRRRWLPMVAVAASLLIGVAVGAAVWSRDGGISPTQQLAAARRTAARTASLAAPDGRHVDVLLDQAGHGLLDGRALPDLGADRTYQLWGIADGAAVSLGVLGSHPGIVQFTAADDVTTLALTDERVGGVVQSTQQPAFAGAVTSS